MKKVVLSRLGTTELWRRPATISAVALVWRDATNTEIPYLYTYNVECFIFSGTVTIHPIVLREDDNKKLLAQINVWPNTIRAVPRVFCGVYTHKNNHQTKLKVRRLRSVESMGNQASERDGISRCGYQPDTMCVWYVKKRM